VATGGNNEGTMKYYQIKLKGETPLLMHHDNLDWADAMSAWGRDPGNKKNSVAGDDRSPAWRWIGALYVGPSAAVGEYEVVMPSDNLMTMLREGGKQCPSGKRGGSFKARTQSGIVIEEPHWQLQIGGLRVPYGPIKVLVENPDFAAHKEVVAALGFELLVKRATVGQSKHVRVRPFFKEWTITGKLMVIDDMITQEVLDNILRFAGAYSGLGDWRPSSPKAPGQMGRFTHTLEPA
jgi:hypothetical protein